MGLAYLHTLTPKTTSTDRQSYGSPRLRQVAVRRRCRSPPQRPSHAQGANGANLNRNAILANLRTGGGEQFTVAANEKTVAVAPEQ